MMSEVEKIAAGLSPRQASALQAFPSDTAITIGDGIHWCRAWRKASELGVSGNTLASMQTFGGVDLKTLLPGPCLVKDDWSREGRHWSLTDLGVQVRQRLQDTTS